MADLFSVLALLVASAGCALSLAVALRVKRLLDPLTEEGGLGAGRRPSGIPLGTAVPQIGGMTDIRGEHVEFPAADGAQWILTFQAVGCSGCKQQLPEYKRFLESAGLGRDRVFSLVIGDEEGVAQYADELGDLSHVVQAGDSLRNVIEEMEVTTWPTYSVISGSGTVSYSAQSSARLAGSENPLSTVAVS
ncbi:hypothetical protein GCM10010284_67710 [Streptomyces rubiginosohelvolus]|uniref:hypothetical protein n=1 Tax=Streptomyces rubiginosohelvolus TaxID=67362 RepID=UPI001672FF82|nr:hypothetical protein [Streptomyces rubiginosohelvolus]GGS25249.1 hypothetical protein GCM10010284_67710 [Streptomyces rubiginosohelvolus]